MNVDLKAKKPLKLSDAAKEARNAYKRAWNAKNKDKVKAATARYWERKAQAMEDGGADLEAKEG